MLSTYVQAVPSTVGLICALTEKGEDNVLKFIGSRSELISEFGEPNITHYTKSYGQGLYCAYNYLGESGSLYFMRCLPEDAAFANMRINVNLVDADATATIDVSYLATANANTVNELLSPGLDSTTGVSPLAILRPIGRGQFYNALGVRFTAHTNPLISGVYVLDIYETQADGTEVIVESFEVSFDPTSVDSSGDSLWITYILENYSTLLRAEMTLESGAFSPGYTAAIQILDRNIGTVSAVETSGSATLTDNKQDFNDWEFTSGLNYPSMVIAKDAKGIEVYGWLNLASDEDGNTIAIMDGREVATAAQNWSGNTSTFDFSSSEITYQIKSSNPDISSAFVSSTPVPLKKGSDGDIVSAQGTLNTTNMQTAIVGGYSGILTSKQDGTIVDTIWDQENIYFSLVFDCGYTNAVKTAISTLVTTRRDCVALMDNGDNATYALSQTARLDTNVMNNYFCALYESYNKVYDIWTGQDVWFSPIFHISYLAPRNDNVAEIWWAIAGFNRASIDSIRELRFNPRLGQRDQMYLKQLNPIVKFNHGYVVWGQLTTQAKASALQDLNIVRLVLYIQRALEQYARFFIFELNDAITWNSVQSDVVEFLESIKKKRGLYSYNVEVGSTAYEIKRKTFHINVTLEPTRVVEKISLNFFIK